MLNKLRSPGTCLLPPFDFPISSPGFHRSFFSFSLASFFLQHLPTEKLQVFNLLRLFFPLFVSQRSPSLRRWLSGSTFVCAFCSFQVRALTALCFFLLLRHVSLSPRESRALIFPQGIFLHSGCSNSGWWLSTLVPFSLPSPLFPVCLPS